MKPKNAYKRLVDRMLPYQFNWMGRTKEGVSRWAGAPKGPSERFCKYVVGYGIVMGIASVCATGMMLIDHHLWNPLLSLALVGGIHGAVFTQLFYTRDEDDETEEATQSLRH